MAKAKTKSNQKFGWHFLPKNKKLKYGDDRKVEVGKPLSISKGEKPKVCNTGMHASEKIAQAAQYNAGPVLCRVIVSGDLDTSAADKFCGRTRTVIWMKELTAADMTAAIVAAGSTVGSYTDQDSLVHRLNSCTDWKLNSTLEAWAKKNGWDDTKQQQVLPTFEKPSLTKDVVLSLLSDRMVRTKHEILKQLGDAYDLTSNDSYNDDAFDEIIEDLKNYPSKVHVVEEFTKNQADGYLKVNRR